MPSNANPIWGDDWEDVRRLWPLDPDVAHCNHGSFGALPGQVLAVQNEFRDRMAVNPMRWFGREMPDLLREAHGHAAEFIGAGPRRHRLRQQRQRGGFGSGAVVAARGGRRNRVHQSRLRSCVLGARPASARTGAKRVVAHVPFDTTDEEVVAIIREHCSERTGLVVLDQVTSPTARRFPIEAVACVAHQFNAALLVDGAHAPGMLPLEVPKLGADFWVGNLHKWACAPPGTGVLWVAPAWRDRMLSLVVSWGEGEGFPTSFERVGTDDLSAWLAAPYSLHLLGSLGWDRVRVHNEALVRWAQATVAEILGMPAGELRHDAGLSMTLVWLPPGVAETREQAHSIQEHMATLGVEMTVGSWNGRGRIRLSAYVYNRPADYERLAIGIRDFIQG